MILQTVIPFEYIFSAENSVRSDFLSIKNGFLEIDKNDNNRIKRVISTDPKDYLNSQYIIGNSIK